MARREFVERARDKAFAISTGITLAILVLVIVLQALFDQGAEFDVSVAGDDGSYAEAVVAAADALGVDVTVRRASDADAAEGAVRDGAVDAAVVQGREIVVDAEGDPRLLAVLQSVSQAQRMRDALVEAGIPEDEAAAILAQPRLPVRALEPRDERQRENAGVAFVGVLALYGQLFAYGYWVAAGVVEEKSSRIVEVLLATLRPSQLLRGKIVGIGVLGLAQLLLIAVVGLATAQLMGSLAFPADAIATIGLVVLWFVLGFFFYAGLFAVAGAIVSRQEDLQTTLTPFTIVIVGSFFIGISATNDPSSTLATVASLLPPSAPLVMPSRIALGEAGLVEALLSIAVSVAATVALVPIATRVYSRAVLRTGKVRIRQVLRAERG